MDKSALSFKENTEKPGTNYTKVKPDIGMLKHNFDIFIAKTATSNIFNFIGSAKPSNLRARFENFAKEKEEEDFKRTAEQKRLREEKDRLDREQATKSQQNGKNTDEETTSGVQSKNIINTGRSGGIGNAINLFNKVEDKPVTPIQRVSIDFLAFKSDFLFSYSFLWHF